jgi:hypothetical protein
MKYPSLVMASLLALGSGQAMATVAGSIWVNDTPGSMDATPGNVPGTPADVTFTALSPLDFVSGPLYTIGEFLSSGGATGVTSDVPLSDTLDNTIFNFTGSVTVTNGLIYTVGSDDGLTLVIDGITVVNAPTPRSFGSNSYTWTGPSGTYPFQLVYGETLGPPAVLEASLPFTSKVPEPATLALFGIGLVLVGFGFTRRRRAS